MTGPRVMHWRDWALSELLRRAGACREQLAQAGVHFVTEESLQPSSTAQCLSFPASSWLISREGRVNSDIREICLRWQGEEVADIPVVGDDVRGNSERRPLATLHATGEVHFHADLLSSTAWLLGRLEETRPFQADKHGRFPAQASLAYREQFLDRPVVDEYARELQIWLCRLLPRWQPKKSKFSIRFSCDVDRVRQLKTPRAALSQARQDVRNGRLIQGVRSAFAAYAPTFDPFYAGIFELADKLERAGHVGEFFFKTSDYGTYDSGYDLASRAMLRAVHSLQKRGHTVGLHPGYESAVSRETLREEVRRFRQITGLENFGGRQHYLRFLAPQTWDWWEEEGMAYDSTLGFADHEGFRAGTCHTYHPYDFAKSCPRKLQEIPLIFMDCTPGYYRGVSVEDALMSLNRLKNACKNVGGEFTILWHNSSLQNDWQRWESLLDAALC